MKTAIITERILFKKGRRIICYIDIMPEKIEVKTGKPSDATCISWNYQPNELERAKATATEFFDNVTRIWTTKQAHNKRREDARSKTFAPFLLCVVRKGKGNNNHTQRATKTTQEDKERQPEQRRTTRGRTRENERQTQGKREKNEGKHATSL